jgi:hypothetical protein
MKLAIERNEFRRTEFLACIGQFLAQQLVFVDESAVDSRTSQRRYGWSREGTRARMKGCFVRGKRYGFSVLHSWRANKPFTFMLLLQIFCPPSIISGWCPPPTNL